MATVVKKSFKWIIGFFILIVFNKMTRLIIFYFKNLFIILYSSYKASELEQIEGICYIEYPLFLKGGKYIRIGSGFSARGRFRIEAWDFYNGNHHSPQIIIGDNVIFNFDCHLGAIHKIQIGNNVLVGSRVMIIDHNHGKITQEELQIAPRLRNLFSKGPVIIEDNVWIGEGAAILPNVRIGRNAIIGANSVVVSDVPDNCVVGGIPARIIKYF